MAPADAFVVARNPEADFSLPYLVRLPLEGCLALKARERPPVTSRVYCHPLEAWPEDVEVLEEVPVRACARRGRAIDLVLDGGRNFRSQFVFTEPHPGRAGGRSMSSGRPRGRPAGRGRASTRRAAGRGPGASSRSSSMPASATPTGSRGVRRRCAARRSPAATTPWRRAERSAPPSSARPTRTSSGRCSTNWLTEVTARLTVRYPSVPLVFCDSRKLAEDFTHRFLAAAMADDETA